MTHSAPPGVPRPAGQPTDTNGRRRRATNYVTPEFDAGNEFENAPVTSPGHGGVAVFQAPQPVRSRSVASSGDAAIRPGPAEHPDIDSPFLDLFGAGPPRPPRTGRSTPSPVPPESATAPASAEPIGGPGNGWRAPEPRTGQPLEPIDPPNPEPDEPTRASWQTDAADQHPGSVLWPTDEPAIDRTPPPMTAPGGPAGISTRQIPEQPTHPPARHTPAASGTTGTPPIPPADTGRVDWEIQGEAPAEANRTDPPPRTTRRALSTSPAPERGKKAGRSTRTPADQQQPRVRPPKVRFGDRDPAIELAITEIAGHLTFTPNTVTAWYWLPEVRWAFRPDAEREALLSAISEQYAGLAGFRLHLRRTTRPFPADEWARTIDAHTPHPLATGPGAVSWSDHLVAAQRHLLSVNHAEGQTYLGVTFARRSLGDSLTERILRTFGRGVADGERRKLGRTVEQFDEVLGAFGMRGRRVTSQELEWLLYRSVALCMAPPGTLSPVTGGHWERGDLLALTEQVERYRTPYGSTVKLVNRMTGEERHVAVLAVGRMEPLEIPERHEPWLHFHERLPWPMELSTRVDVLGSADSFRNLEHRLRMIRSQQLDYAEHGIDAPPELERLAKRALVIGDEMTTGLPVDSARAHGWHRIAVGGRTREECLERARRLIQLYSRELRISLQHPKNQDWLAREFIPGEPIANTGYIRRMPVNLLAAALPQAASTVGDRRGDLIGRTAGTCRRPVFLDLHFPMEVRERSGLAVFVAEPGGGKSTLLGALGYLAARRGVQVTLLDPSGPLARLCQMPELRPYSRVLNLTGSEQGTLAPYALIPTPLRSEFGTGASRRPGVRDRHLQRPRRTSDAGAGHLHDAGAAPGGPGGVHRHPVAARGTPGTRRGDARPWTTWSPAWPGLTTTTGRELANLLLDTAEMPLALLFFGRPPEGLLGADAALTVITMAGLRLPDLKIEREYWSAEEALALPMLHTAHRLAVRRCYGGLDVVPQAGRPGRGALHGGLALRPLLPGPARPRLPQVEPRRAGRLAEPEGHPRPGRTEPRLHRLRRPDRRGHRDRLRGTPAAAGAGQ